MEKKQRTTAVQRMKMMRNRDSTRRKPMTKDRMKRIQVRKVLRWWRTKDLRIQMMKLKHQEMRGGM